MALENIALKIPSSPYAVRVLYTTRITTALSAGT